MCTRYEVENQNNASIFKFNNFFDEKVNLVGAFEKSKLKIRQYFLKEPGK